MLRAIHVHQVFWGLYQGPQLLQPPKKAVEFYGSVFAVRAQGLELEIWKVKWALGSYIYAHRGLGVPSCLEFRRTPYCI